MTRQTTIVAQPGTPFIEISREFDATAAQLFRAHTEPDLIVRWLGPRNLKMDLIELDARTGGGYRYVHRDDEGNEYRFRGVFHTIATDERIIQTFEYEGAPGDVCLESITFTAHGGHTRLDDRSVFPSVEARDAALASGMEHGIRESYERLTELTRSER